MVVKLGVYGYLRLTTLLLVELAGLMRGYGWTPHFVEGDEPTAMHQAMAATLDLCLDQIHAIQGGVRSSGEAARAHWPMIVLRTPKGWTGPETVDGLREEMDQLIHQYFGADLDSLAF